MKTRHPMICIGVFSLLLSACQHGLSQLPASHERVDIRILEQSFQCPRLKAGVTEVTTSQQWSKILATSPLSQPVVLPKAWLEQYRLFAIGDGAKPNAGYGVKVLEQAQWHQPDTESRKLLMTATLKSPAPGSITAQVMTSPCVLVGAPKGDYQVRLITN